MNIVTATLVSGAISVVLGYLFNDPFNPKAEDLVSAVEMLSVSIITTAFLGVFLKLVGEKDLPYGRFVVRSFIMAGVVAGIIYKLVYGTMFTILDLTGDPDRESQQIIIVGTAVSLSSLLTWALLHDESKSKNDLHTNRRI